jgi:hypothetical protein
VIVCMVPWVEKFSGCCRGSWTCGKAGGRGGLVSVLTWLALVFLGVRYVICGTTGDRLFVELMKFEDGWWWRSGMIDNMPEVVFSYFGRLGLDNGEGRMENIASSAEPIAWCG